MRIGLLFPGQGSQCLGMGKDIYDDYETYRNVVKKVNEYTGLNLEEITYNSSEEILNQTKNTQIAILTMSLGILEILKENKVETDYEKGVFLHLITDFIFFQNCHSRCNFRHHNYKCCRRGFYEGCNSPPNGCTYIPLRHSRYSCLHLFHSSFSKNLL